MFSQTQTSLQLVCHKSDCQTILTGDVLLPDGELCKKVTYLIIIRPGRQIDPKNIKDSARIKFYLLSYF